MRINVQYDQTPQRKYTFWENWQVMELMTQFPALTLRVLFHRRVGLRRAEPTHVLIMAAILLAIAYYAHNVPLELFAVADALAGCWQHYNRWKELRGETAAPWHTFSDGVSPVEDLIVRRLETAGDMPASSAPASGRRIALSSVAPITSAVLSEAVSARRLPTGEEAQKAMKEAKAKAVEHLQKPSFLKWLSGDSRIYRRIEPVIFSLIGFALMITGVVMSNVGASVLDLVTNAPEAIRNAAQAGQDAAGTMNPGPLGFWFVFAAACLAVDENLKWRHQIRDYLDWYDSQIDGASLRTWGGTKGKRRVQPAASRRQSYGLPTGIGNDIRASVEWQAHAVEQQRREQQQAIREEQAQRPQEWKRGTPPVASVLDAPDNRLPILQPNPSTSPEGQEAARDLLESVS